MKPIEAHRLEAVLATLLPAGAVVSVWNGGPDPKLYAAEEVSIWRAVPKRVREFSRGRACARVALDGVGAPIGPIPAGPDRAPVWPAGYIASITHCDGLVAAVAARQADIPALGVDAEPAEPLPIETRELILHPSERFAGGDAVLERVVFSAKESIHKTLHPVDGIWMDFLDVVVELDRSGGRFRASPAPHAKGTSPGLARLLGRFVVTDGFVLTVGHLTSPG